MDREISQEEARKRLEDSVKEADLIKHFLGDKSHQDRFLEVYRGLHAQLREGDELTIELDLTKFMTTAGSIEPGAVFQIVLIKEGQRYFVYNRYINNNNEWNLFSSLYDNAREFRKGI